MTMTLQQITIKKIDDYGGRAKLTKALKKYSKFLNGRERKQIDTMIMYINSLYFAKVNIKADAVNKRSHAKRFIGTLNFLIARYDADSLKFLKELIEYNLSHLEQVKKLTG